MRIGVPVALAIASVVTCVSAQQPAITSFHPDGTIAWTNISTNCVAIVEELSLATSNEWSAIHSEPVTAVVASARLAMTSSHAWFRVANSNESSVPPGMVSIPGGSNSGRNPLASGESYDSCDYPATYSLSVGSFYMDRYEVTNDEMVDVLQWAYDHGRISATWATVENLQGNQQILLRLYETFCRINWNGSSFTMELLKGSGYPCVEVSWYGAAAYCNYRSEMEGRTPCYDLSNWSCSFSADGYRLPTSEEWEYAARGGLASKRFPWGNTISHSQANYFASTTYSYDLSSGGRHPSYDTGGIPYTSPVGSFAANAWGLYDMAGNVMEWCSDWHPCKVGLERVIRNGGFRNGADVCRVGYRIGTRPGHGFYHIGFRAVLPPGQ